jgi:putative ABC transport system substrate-binding protein
MDILRPDGNITGLVNKEIDTARQLRMLAELLRSNGKSFSPLAVLYNHSNSAMAPEIQEIEEAAAAMDPKIEIRPLTVDGPEYDFDQAFAAYGDCQGLIVLEEPVIVQNRGKVAQFAREHAVPGMYETRTFLEEGGLVCYGPDRHEMYLRMADYVKRIADHDLRPGNLPPMEEVEPTLHVNRDAARALGITEIPTTLDGVHWAS